MIQQVHCRPWTCFAFYVHRSWIDHRHRAQNITWALSTVVELYCYHGKQLVMTLLKEFPGIGIKPFYGLSFKLCCFGVVTWLQKQFGIMSNSQKLWRLEMCTFSVNMEIWQRDLGWKVFNVSIVALWMDVTRDSFHNCTSNYIVAIKYLNLLLFIYFTYYLYWRTLFVVCFHFWLENWLFNEKQHGVKIRTMWWAFEIKLKL